jgi:hypothetical protein
VVDIRQGHQKHSHQNQHKDLDFGCLVFGEVAVRQFAVLDVDVGEGDRCHEDEAV